MQNKRRKVLYFSAGMFPSDAEIAYALDNGCAIRNAALDDPATALEDCDAVAGDAPKRYRDAYEYVGGADAADKPKRRGRPPKAADTNPAKSIDGDGGVQ